MSIPQTTHGGAGSVRNAGAGRRASMTVLDVDSEDPRVKRDGWFAYVMPTQTGVEMVGSGRYGYWEERPKVVQDGAAYRIEGGAEEPILLVTAVNATTAYIAQAQHLEAMPLPMPQEPGESK